MALRYGNGRSTFMTRYYSHKITKRERAAIATLYAPNSTRPGIRDQQSAQAQSRNVHEPLFVGTAEREFGDSAARIGDAAAKRATQTARED